MKKILITFLTGISLLLSAQQKTNILFIAVDDLKPELGVYGADYIHTPHIDALAGQGVTFTNAHCQQAVCGPSRASLMTGMRPDYTGVWDLKTRMRDINPDILSMPQYFKDNGYKTIAVGKIYDPRCVAKDYDAESWSIPYAESAKYTYPKEYGEPGLSYYALAESKEIVHRLEAEAIAKGENKHQYVSERFKPSTEMADVSDEAYIDGQIANNAISYMKELATQEEPFFLAVGFKRPHLPFAAPTKYWEMYKREDIKLAEYREPVKNGVDIAYHNSGEMQSYTDIPALSSFSDINTMILPEDKQKELIHGYYASVSYIDAQIGRVMAELKASGLDKNTVVVLWGDHGWHLGDHNLWCKHSNFENATRVPLIITAPGYKPSEYKHPAELLDIFPTLCELTAVPTPSHLQGLSLVPALESKHNMVKPIAVSQFSRGQREGYSIRSDRFRLTLWMNNKYKTYLPFDEKLIYAGELYDYTNDPLETLNVFDSESYAKVKAQLFQLFKEYVLIQNNELQYTGANPEKTKRSNDLVVVDVAPVVAPSISLGEKIEDHWNVVMRKGADAQFSITNGELKCDISKLGERPWDLQLAYKDDLHLKAGQTLSVTMLYQGPEMKMNFGPVNKVRIGRKIAAQKTAKLIIIEVPITESGVYPCKLSFVSTGKHLISDIKTNLK